ncbi:hypothetical protein B0H67DRAFT_554649 [Lasiosphaeris hirsuta]|uniref:Uncharacterized protein n=1 Tax=Lasiosphaeris hirsuta TaxID=260670 RepID=A0AA40AI92_9PEZI|nr:hypothetical protein B0H67DRAFT_554649 [Lasiosphaeris hirsuta]
MAPTGKAALAVGGTTTWSFAELCPDDNKATHNCNTCGIWYAEVDKWAFRSRVWDECEFRHINLSTPHRQKDSMFTSMLWKCRLGLPFSPDEINVLMSHKSSTTHAVRLFSTREEARLTYEVAFAWLSSKSRSYACYDVFSGSLNPNLAQRYGRKSGDGSLVHFGNDHRFARHIDLKVGMQVILLVNLKLPRKSKVGGSNSLGSGLVGEQASLQEQHIQTFAERQTTSPGWPLVRFLHGPQSEGRSAKCHTRNHLPRVLCDPRAQGMTLDRVVVDLTRAFTWGQVYVALSRANLARRS